MEHEIFEHAVVIEQCIIHVERKNYLFSKHTLDFLPDRSFAVICFASARRPRLLLAPSVHRHGGLLFFFGSRTCRTRATYASLFVICECDPHRQPKNELRDCGTSRDSMVAPTVARRSLVALDCQGELRSCIVILGRISSLQAAGSRDRGCQRRALPREDPVSLHCRCCYARRFS